MVSEEKYSLIILLLLLLFMYNFALLPNFLLVADVIANFCCCVRCYDTIIYHYYCFVTNVCHSGGLICG